MLLRASPQAPSDATLQMARAITLYATEGPSLDRDALQREGIAAYAAFELGGLRPSYEKAKAQMPRVVAAICHRTGELLSLKRESLGDPLGEYEVVRFNLYAFALPYGAIVIALDALIRSDDRAGRVQFLRDTSFRKHDVEIDGAPLVAAAAGLAAEPVRHTLIEHRIGLVHQIFCECDVRGFAPTDPPTLRVTQQEAERLGDQPFQLDSRYVDALIHHGFSEQRPSTSRLEFPVEANHETALLHRGVTNSTTTWGGLGRAIENGMMLGAVECVASSAQAAAIRERGYAALTRFMQPRGGRDEGASRRSQLAKLSDELSHLRLDLAFGVEAYLDMGLVLSDFRVAGYHRSLVSAMSVPQGADTIRELLDRLAEAVAAALNAVESDEAAVRESRGRQLSAVGTMLALVAVPLTLLFAFLGINASQVSTRRSVFDVDAYGLWYLTILGVCVLVFLFALLWERRR